MKIIFQFFNYTFECVAFFIRILTDSGKGALGIIIRKINRSCYCGVGVLKFFIASPISRLNALLELFTSFLKLVVLAL